MIEQVSAWISVIALIFTICSCFIAIRSFGYAQSAMIVADRTEEQTRHAQNTLARMDEILKSTDRRTKEVADHLAKVQLDITRLGGALSSLKTQFSALEGIVHSVNQAVDRADRNIELARDYVRETKESVDKFELSMSKVVRDIENRVQDVSEDMRKFESTLSDVVKSATSDAVLEQQRSLERTVRQIVADVNNNMTGIAQSLDKKIDGLSHTIDSVPPGMFMAGTPSNLVRVKTRLSQWLKIGRVKVVMIVVAVLGIGLLGLWVYLLTANGG